MSPDVQISIAIPTYCRAEMLAESFQDVLYDPRVREVVISDDRSPDGSFERLLSRWRDHDKVRVFRNKSNLDCYRNKRQAVEHATSEWVILFDDDNVIKPDYLNALYSLAAWDPKVIYAPDWAKPHFNYTRFAGQRVDRRTVARYMCMQHYKTALNTCNYFAHRESYLASWDGSVDPITADSLFHAYNWFAAGGSILIVQGLRYFHRIHDGSHYKMNHKRTGDFLHRLERKLKLLR